MTFLHRQSNKDPSSGSAAACKRGQCKMRGGWGQMIPPPREPDANDEPMDLSAIPASYLHRWHGTRIVYPTLIELFVESLREDGALRD